MRKQTIKNIQISDNDLEGNRFNGHDLHLHLQKRGIDSKQLVWKKRSNDPSTFEIARHIKNKQNINKLIKKVEKELCLQSSLYPFSHTLLYDQHFLAADVVHYHLIHNHFFNIGLFPFLTRLKPSVWTLHDPWALTGHCIHPFDCTRWQIGCGDCPQLETQIPLKQDTTALNWELKKIYYQHSNIDIVVASKWMLNMVQQSPLFSHCTIHYIPFGLNLDLFQPLDPEGTKKQFGIASNTKVIAFRATPWEFKGLESIKSMLHKLQPEQPICLLTFNEKGLLDEFKGRYQVIDLGWVKDEHQLISAYNAADFLLMPSSAESFGMMAIEAMACGKPSIVMEGTALPDTIFAPEGGIAVPQGDIEALRNATETLLLNPEKCRQLGDNARKISSEHYSFEAYIQSIIALYQDIFKRRAPDIQQYSLLFSQLEKITLEDTKILSASDKKLQKIQSSPWNRIPKKFRTLPVARRIAHSIIMPATKFSWAFYKKLSRH